MVIDYSATRGKVNELNRSAISIIDMLAIVESGLVSGEPLTQIQIDNLKTRLKAEADILKDIAGEIKTLVS